MRKCEYCGASLNVNTVCECAQAKEARRPPKEIEYLRVEHIFPHPRNPRKALGDLTELAASITENGLKQPLTVIPLVDKPDSTSEFTVVIGHRRLAAATAAGLTSLPCFIEEMDEREQIHTMLLENMQRKELTPLEEAEGFQYALDLGDSFDELAEKTGLSKSTVRHRVKLLELDRTGLEKTLSAGAKMSDYIRLEGIEDIDARNNALAFIGTNNFEWNLNKVIQSQNDAKEAAVKIEFAKTFAVEADEEKRKELVAAAINKNAPYNSLEPDETGVFHAPDDADTVQYYYFIPVWSSASVLIYREPTEAEADEKANPPVSKADRLRERQIEACKLAYNLRTAFVKDYKPINNAATMMALLEFIRDRLMGGSWFDSSKLKSCVSATPHQLAWEISKAVFSDNDKNGFGIWGRYDKNEKLIRLYTLLTALGYVLSDEERDLMDGSHEVYNSDSEKNA
jgi:ParB family chromosome partitioning protein